MEIWQGFWTIALLGSATAFAGITLVVMIKGGKDMKNMLRGLKSHHDDDKTH
jgi:hypothetical protein